MKFTEGNEIHWLTCPDSHKPHIGIPHGVEFKPIKTKGRFALVEQELSLLPVPTIYPIGVSTLMAGEMEDATAQNSHIRTALLKRAQTISFV